MKDKYPPILIEGSALCGGVLRSLCPRRQEEAMSNEDFFKAVDARPPPGKVPEGWLSDQLKGRPAIVDVVRDCPDGHEVQGATELLKELFEAAGYFD